MTRPACPKCGAEARAGWQNAGQAENTVFACGRHVAGKRTMKACGEKPAP